jgi:hypothetical protein
MRRSSRIEGGYANDGNVRVADQLPAQAFDQIA